MYYKPQQPVHYKKLQQYLNYRTKQQVLYRNDHDKEKVGKRGFTNSGITSSDIKNYQLFQWVMSQIIVGKKLILLVLS